MADISKLSRLLNGIERQVDLSTNTLVVGSIKIGTASPTELTKTILDKLILINTAADADGTFDTRYTKIANLSAQTNGASGASLVGIDVTPAFSNFTSGNNVQSALEGIDAALATAGGTSFSDSVFQIYDNGDITKLLKFEVSGITTGTTRTITMPDANVDLGNLTNSNLSASAAIDYSKLAALTSGNILVGSAGNVATSVAMSGEASIVAAGTVTLSNSAVIAKVLTGYTSGAGTVAATDSILAAIQKLNGNTTAISASVGAVNGIATLDANGLVPITQMPPAALERLVIVADQAARFALTTATVQNGDTVKQTDTGVMYFVSDDTNLGNAAGYTVYTAGTASAVAWSGVTGTPTTLAGYGITDYAAAAKAAAVSDSITDGITDVAPSQNAVFDALALKANLASPTFTGTVVADIIAATGSVTGSNLSGTNTGDQTITLTGDVTGSGTGSFAATIANSAVTLAKIASNAVDENKIVSTSFDASITGGSGTKISVASAPAVKAVGEIAGEAFSAATVYAVRYGQDAETASTMYKADLDATTVDNFNVIGLVLTVGALSATDPMPAITKMGLFTATGASFTVGKPVFLSTSGTLTSTAPSTANMAVVRVGIAKSATVVDVNIQVVGVY